MTELSQRNVENFTRMLEQVSGGLDFGTVSSAELKESANRCAGCSEAELCDNWLDQAKRSDRRAPGFCPITAGIWSKIAS